MQLEREEAENRVQQRLLKLFQGVESCVMEAAVRSPVSPPVHPLHIPEHTIPVHLVQFPVV